MLNEKESGITHRQVMSLAWPMILSNLTIPMLGVVDTAILGHLGDPVYLAAVAGGTTLLTFLLWSFGFLKMGTTGIVARSVGSKNLNSALDCLLQSSVLAIGLSVLIWILQWAFLPTALLLINPNPDSYQWAFEYTSIRLLAAPFTLMNFVIVGWFIGFQNTKTPLVLMVFINLINILFDYIFVIGFDLKSTGAAWASVIADVLGFLLGLIYIYTVLKRLNISNRLFVSIKALSVQKKYFELIQINSQLFIRTACLLGVITFFTSQGARLGEYYLAANAILMQIVAIISYGLDGFAHAAQALVGRATGANNLKLFKEACLKTGFWALATALFFSLMLWLLKIPIVHFFTNINDVLILLDEYYQWLLLFAVFSFLAYHLDGILIGWGKTGAMRNSMLFCTFCIFIPAWWLSRELGNHGLWLAFLLFNVFRGISLLGFVNYKFRNDPKNLLVTP
ncbi:MATE family efflux transporter [Sessilibacter sp. MAH1]